MAPLEYWRNEKVEYKKGQYGTEVKAVVHIPQDTAMPYAAKKRYARSRSRSVKPKMGKENSVDPRNVGIRHIEAGWDDQTTALGKVLDFETGQEIERRRSDVRLKLMERCGLSR